MRFRTTVETSRKLDVTHKTGMMLVGSCFVENIGRRLCDCKFRVDVNPFGILYNPLSITVALRRIISGGAFQEDSSELFFYQERWHSILHHGDFSHRDKHQVLNEINDRLASAHRHLLGTDLLILTLGTAFVYRTVAEGKVVGNCHKLPANNFVRTLASVDEIVSELSAIIEQLLKIRPSMQLLFTVSPIRHLRDGAHGNQLSKAVLLLAVERLMSIYPDSCGYFPAYEIMLDDLRDYRFYADDMLHPSSQAVDYIWERFSEYCFDNHEMELNRRIEEINRALFHRPDDETSENYRNFIASTLEKIKKIHADYPYIDFEREFIKCNTLLNK